MKIAGFTFSDTMRFKAEVYGPNNKYTVIENATIGDLKGYCRNINKHYSGYSDFSIASMEKGESKTFETPRCTYVFKKVAD